MNASQRTIARFRAETRNVTRATTILLFVFAIATIGLLVASFLVPPLGTISPSVLKAGALLFAFATLVEAREAIREGLGVKLTHGDTTIEVHDLDGHSGEDPQPENRDSSKPPAPDVHGGE